MASGVVRDIEITLSHVNSWMRYRDRSGANLIDVHGAVQMRQHRR
jgi:hypothetical protein